MCTAQSNVWRGPYERWSQEYNSLLQHVKNETGSRVDPSQKDKMSILELLQCYSRVLTTRNELNYEDAINVLQNFQISDKAGNGSTRQLLSHSLEQLKVQLAPLTILFIASGSSYVNCLSAI